MAKKIKWNKQENSSLKSLIPLILIPLIISILMVLILIWSNYRFQPEIYCDKNPNDEEKCVCEEEQEEREIKSLGIDWEKVGADCVHIDRGCITYLILTQLSPCKKARPLTNFEKFKRDNPDCIYYSKNSDGGFGCVKNY